MPTNAAPRWAWVIFRWVWAFTIIAIAVGFGAACGWHKHGLVAAIALGFVGLVVGAPFACSPRGTIEVLATMLTI